MIMEPYLLSSIHDKYRTGIVFEHGLLQQTNMIIDPLNKVKLKSFSMISFQVDVPYNQYLLLGFSLDLFRATSHLRGNAMMTPKKVDKTAMGALIGFKARPQIPFSFSFGDLFLFSAVTAGLGGTPAFTFGSHNLNRYSYDEYKNYATNFPIVFKTGVEAGVEYYFSEIFGIEFKTGYRILWFAHPIVNKVFSYSVKRAKESIIFYDAGSLFIGASLKISI